MSFWLKIRTQECENSEKVGVTTQGANTGSVSLPPTVILRPLHVILAEGQNPVARSEAESQDPYTSEASNAQQSMDSALRAE